MYKVSHADQYPPDTESIYSNLTARSSRLESVDRVVFFGLQYFLKEYLLGQFEDNFFRLHEKTFYRALHGFKRRLDTSLGGDNDVSRWESLWRLGYLPLEIKALPEGALVPLRVPLLTVRSTHSEFFWLGQWVETLLSNVIWFPITTATISYQYRKLVDKYINETSDQLDMAPWICHDFSMRGMTSINSSAAGGAGHLLSFYGTDTIPSIDFLEEYYLANAEKEIIGGSISSTEHSVMCTGGKEGEYDIYKRLLTEVYPNGNLGIVSDTYDLFNVLTNYLPRLKNVILSRSGKTVIRPDCYDEQTQILTPNGWKYFKYLTEDDEVAQVLDDGTYEFVKPIRIINQYYNGPMIHFKDHHGKLDLLVTTNHRMVFEKNGKLKIEEAEYIKFYFGKNLLRSAKSIDQGRSLTPIERLQIAFQADGSYPSKGMNNIRFSFSKSRKINRLKDILHQCGLDYKIYLLKDGRVEFNIKYDANTISKNFDWVDISDLCSNWCCEFIEELSHWDSNIRNENKIKFDTTNKSVIDKVELIALSAGYGILISVYEDDRKDIFSDVYTAHILTENRIGGQSIEKQHQYYSGNIYCVQVPSGKVLVKRNRCTLVSGNSGDPVNILCGNPTSQSEVEKKGVIQLLWDTFSGITNSKGYKELDPHIGAIYGDSITLTRCKEIFRRLKENGFACTNTCLGIGSFSFQYNTRDTFGLAFKSTAYKKNGEWRAIYKDPITDNGMKKSARGLLMVNRPYIPCEDLCDDKNFQFGDYTLIENVDEETERSSWNCLQPVFKDGLLVKEWTLSEIRSRLHREG